MLETFLHNLQTDALAPNFLWSLFIIFASGFWLIYKFEISLRTDNFPMIKKMVQNSRERDIAFLLRDEIANALSTGFNHGRNSIYPLEYDPISDERKRSLKPADEIESFFGSFDPDRTFRNSSEEWSASKSGDTLMRKIQENFVNTAKIRHHYEKAIRCCKSAWIASFILAFFMLVLNILRMLQGESLTKDIFLLWLVLFFIVLGRGLIYFAAVLWHKEKITSYYENSEINA